MQIKPCQSVVTSVLFCSLGLFLTGCNDSAEKLGVTLVPVTGKVTKSGEPVSVLLHFTSTVPVVRKIGPQDRGPIVIHPGCPSNKQGEFVVQYKTSDGAPAGEYDILIYTLPERLSLEAFQSESDPGKLEAIRAQHSELQQGILPPGVEPAVVKRVTIPPEGLTDVVWELDGLPTVPPK